MTNSRTCRGVALLLVLAVLGMVAVMGFALLANGTLQVQASHSESLATSARANAASGMELAAFYLQYPHRAPTLNADGYWPGGQDIALGSSTAGTVSLSVTRVARNTYNVTSTGAAAARGQDTITRQIAAQLWVNPGLDEHFGLSFAGNVTLPPSTTVYGDVQATKTLLNLGRIHGKVHYGQSALLGPDGFWEGTTPLDIQTNTPIPTVGQLKEYDTYTLNGRQYQAAELPGTSLSSGTTLRPDSSNPAGVFIRRGDLTIGSHVTVQGTLIVNGKLSVAGGNNTITAREGFPALVVKSDLVLKGSGFSRDLTANGTSWVGEGIKSTGYVATGWLRFNGSLFFGGQVGVDLGFGGRVIIVQDPNQPTAPDLDRTAGVVGVKTIWWRE